MNQIAKKIFNKEGHYITISSLEIDKKGKDIFFTNIEAKCSFYIGKLINNIEISFIYKSIDKIKHTTSLTAENVNYHTYSYYKLPITMNPLEYGKLLRTYNNVYISQLNNNNILIVTNLDDHNQVELYKLGEKSFEWSDRRIDDNKFIRNIGNVDYLFENNILKHTFKNTVSLPCFSYINECN